MQTITSSIVSGSSERSEALLVRRSENEYAGQPGSAPVVQYPQQAVQTSEPVGLWRVQDYFTDAPYAHFGT